MTEEKQTGGMSEKGARQVLSIFKEHNIKAGQAIQAGAIFSASDRHGFHMGEIFEGICFMTAHAWIEEIENGQFRLTEVGFSEMV